MRVVTIEQTEWFTVDVDDDTLTDEEAKEYALTLADNWQSSGYLELEIISLEVEE